MAGAMFKQLPSYFDQFCEDVVLIFIDFDYTLLFTSSDCFAVAAHSGQFCSYNDCKFHILFKLKEEFPNDFESVPFSYQKVDCLYATYKYFIHAETIIEIRGYLMEQLSKAVQYNRCRPFMDTNRPSLVKKRLLRKKRKFQRVKEGPKTNRKKSPISQISGAVELHRSQKQKEQLILQILNLKSTVETVETSRAQHQLSPSHVTNNFIFIL